MKMEGGLRSSSGTGQHFEVRHLKKRCPRLISRKQVWELQKAKEAFPRLWIYHSPSKNQRDKTRFKEGHYVAEQKVSLQMVGQHLPRQETGQNNNGQLQVWGILERQGWETKSNHPSAPTQHLRCATLHIKTAQNAVRNVYEINNKIRQALVSCTQFDFLASILAMLQPISLSHRFSLLGPDSSAAPNSFHSCDKPVN